MDRLTRNDTSQFYHSTEPLIIDLFTTARVLTVFPPDLLWLQTNEEEERTPSNLIPAAAFIRYYTGIES